jgi:hypothetical protein
MWHGPVEEMKSLALRSADRGHKASSLSCFKIASRRGSERVSGPGPGAQSVFQQPPWEDAESSATEVPAGLVKSENKTLMREFGPDQFWASWSFLAPGPTALLSKPKLRH